MGRTTAGAAPLVTILVVEEDASAARAYEQLLTLEGFEVVLARTRLDALGTLAARALEISAILTDFDDSEVDALELSSQVRALRPEMPILYVSGLPEDYAVLREVLALPLTELAPKPVDILAVAAALRRMLNERSARLDGI